jgi:hypothetical protein
MVMDFFRVSLDYISPISYRRRHFEALMSIAKSVRADTARTFNARNPAASLYYLPAELIYEICEYLPIAETFGSWFRWL